MVSVIFSRTSLWAIFPQQRSNYNQQINEASYNVPIIISKEMKRLTFQSQSLIGTVPLSLVVHLLQRLEFQFNQSNRMLLQKSSTRNKNLLKQFQLIRCSDSYSLSCFLMIKKSRMGKSTFIILSVSCHVLDNKTIGDGGVTVDFGLSKSIKYLRSSNVNFMAKNNGHQNST